MKRLILALLVSLAAFGQTTVNLGPVLNSEGLTAVQTWITQRIVSSPSTLNGAIGAATTSIVVADGTQFTVNQSILVGAGAGAEAMNISAISTNTLTVIRGILGTTASVHANLAPVSILQYPTVAALFKADIAKLVAAIIDQIGSPTVNTQLTTISTAQAAITAAKTAAVQ